MTDAPTPDDYDREDGYNARRGLWNCPHCDVIYSANGGYIGRVYGQDGTRYADPMETKPGDGPYFCADCWDVLVSNRRRQGNRSIEDYA